MEFGSCFGLNILLFLLCFNFKGTEGGNNALFIFGDSTVDPGNNNYIETIPENQANYKPYAQNGFFSEPTGRFSDGRIIVDYLGKKIVLNVFFYFFIFYLPTV